MPSVAAANWIGAVAATQHLLELGHRRIGMISGPTDYLCSRERLDACRAAMETRGVTVDPQLVRTGEFNFDDGLALGHQLLSLPHRPTAVLCGNDLQALALIAGQPPAQTRIELPTTLVVRASTAPPPPGA